MALVTDRSEREVALAGKVARLCELRSVILLQSRAHLNVDRLKPVGRGSRPASLEPDISMRAEGKLVSQNVLQARLRFRLAAAERGATKQPIFQIVSVFLLEYQLADGFRPTPEELKAFVSANGLFHCWPYWRELVQNTTTRMGLPPVTLPFFRVRSKIARVPKSNTKSKVG